MTEVEFDAGIILKERERCGLHDLQRLWQQMITTSSFCTMSPAVGEWVLKCANEETKENGQHCLGLAKIAKHVTPELSSLAGTNGKHDAGDDAHLAYAVFAGLVQRVKKTKADAPGSADSCAR